MVVKCPAKVNLFLSVGRKDGRGYHPLRTVFQAIDLCDTLEIETEPAVPGFFCDDPAVPEENTVTKAHRLLAQATNLPQVRLTLHKRIPAESGLGGGSSDAAGLLRAMGAGVGEDVLRAIALEVGADVPFFLVGGRAQAEGYGEMITPMPDQPAEWFLVVRPDVGCPTGEMFRKLDAMQYEWRDFPQGDELYNDFERVAPCESLDLIERLQVHGARDAALSGSGSAVFGRFSNPSIAAAAQDALAADGYSRSWVAKTLSRNESFWG